MRLVTAALLTLLSLAGGCAGSQTVGGARPDAISGTDAQPLATWRMALLREAFDAASSIPEEPHLRDKAKAQEWCASAALSLGEVELALEWANAMKTWRQAAMLADIAGWHAERGEMAQMEALAERALSLAPRARDWQQERIRVHVARAYARAGRDARATALSSGVGEPEMGKVEAVVAGRSGPGESPSLEGTPTFDAQLEQADAWIKTLNFDLTRNAAEVCIALYAGCQADPARCVRIERSVAAANATLPPDIRISNLLALARIAVAAGNRDRAVPLVEAAGAVLASGTWLPEDEIVQVAAVALGKCGIGRPDEARADLARAVALFDQKREAIVDIYRAAPLRAVAVTQARMGDGAQSLVTFLRAIDEGAINPNARPRAEDLTETCVAMVTAGIDPGDAGRARIDSIRSGLVDPW